ncbi:MAG TPA: ASCH domain-containing protein [Pontiellaceae bacterium]|nr:ASCH domain-containing protein [Pontiellaceae bacterium]
MFFDHIISGKKIHTIRANAKGYYKDGDVVQITQWSGAPYRSKVEKTGVVIRIGLEPVTLALLDNGTLSATVGFKTVLPVRLAQNDGLPLERFIDWFFPLRKPGIFKGSIVHFSSFRYSKGTNEKA